MTRAKTEAAAHERTKDELIAGLRELLDMQADLIDEKDREIAALKRTLANRDRAAQRRNTA